MAGRQTPQTGGAGDKSGPDRRALLKGIGAAGGLFGFGGGSALAQEVGPAAPSPDAAALPCTSPDLRLAREPFYGAHQSGILTPQPGAALFASFDVAATDGRGLRRLMRRLTDRIAVLTAGGTVKGLDEKFPPADSGILGSDIRPDGLTMTVSVGASLFDDRFGLATLRPRQLVAMDRFPNDAPDPARCHGDLMIQICAHHADTVLHALRDIIRSTPDLLAPRWTQSGFLPGAGERAGGTPRNLLGFKDGTANPDRDDAPLMERMLWVGTERDEPAWARGGSYQVVRIIRMLVERWDRTPLGEQQVIFGREKETGAPLGRTMEYDDPGYEDDPHGRRIALDAHIRMANPRTAESTRNLILRRGYSYSGGLTKSGQLDMGLVFVCYQASLDDGFRAVQARLGGERLEEYVKPVGGGYFFALPGLADEAGFLGQALLDSAA